MSYKIAAIANLLVVSALGIHHWQYPNIENRMFVVLALPLIAVLYRWIRTARNESLIPNAYLETRRFGYSAGMIFIWLGTLAALAVVPVFYEITRHTQYLYVAGGFVAISAFLFAFGFLIVELDLKNWQNLQSTE